jgi:class 3 adenylate cyclase
MRPETRYTKVGEVHIAYQVVGEGPLDLVHVPGWISHLEHAWEHSSYARFFERLSSFSRLILFDKRGTGMCDRDVGFPTLEERMDDVRGVMDAVGSERAAILGTSEGGNMSMLFAATYPERTVALVTFGVFAARIRSTDYPWAPSPEDRERWYRALEEDWGGPVEVEDLAPSLAGNDAFRRWWATYLRLGASPQAVLSLARTNTEIDVREVLPAIRIPTLVLHRIGDRDVRVEEARYIASRIPGSRLVELPGEDHLIFVGDQDHLLDEVEEFLTGSRPAPDPDRVLLTVLILDIVGSTHRAAEMGDRRWRELLERFRGVVRDQLGRHQGREMDTAGDGFLALFDGPARAVRSALASRDAVRDLGLQIRSGVHTGEVELTEEGVAGIAIHIAARLMAEASPSEVLVSRTVTDLVAGSGLAFEDRGERRLKGVPGAWRLYAASDERPH